MLEKETEKNCLGKKVYKMWSHISEKWPLCPLNYFRRKLGKNSKKINHESVHNL